MVLGVLDSCFGICGRMSGAEARRIGDGCATLGRKG